MHEGKPDASAMFFVVFVGEHTLENFLFCHLANALLLNFKELCLWQLPFEGVCRVFLLAFLKSFFC
jgi:hypothetical protein